MATHTNQSTHKKPTGSIAQRRLADFKSTHDADGGALVVESVESRCLACGREVDTEVARVIGNNDDDLPVCSRCWITPDNRRFESDGRAVQAYLIDQGRRRDGVDGPEHGRRRTERDGPTPAGANGTLPGGWDR